MVGFEGKKLVVPIDFSEPSRRALDEAIAIATDASHVYAIYAAASPSAMSPEAIWQDISEEMRRSKINAYFKQEFPDEKYRGVSFEVLFGDAGHRIAEYAEAIGGDLIVMPSHGRTGIKRLLLGSVAERVLRLAHCPVLILRD